MTSGAFGVTTGNGDLGFIGVVAGGLGFLYGLVCCCGLTEKLKNYPLYHCNISSLFLFLNIVTYNVFELRTLSQRLVFPRRIF